MPGTEELDELGLPEVNTECGTDAEKPPKKRKPGTYDSKTGTEAARKRWSKKQFADRRKEFKQAIMANLDPDHFAKGLARCVEHGLIDGVRCYLEVGKFMGTDAQTEERAQNINLNANVKKAETVKLVIEDFTKPDEAEKPGEADA